MKVFRSHYLKRVQWESRLLQQIMLVAAKLSDHMSANGYLCQTRSTKVSLMEMLTKMIEQTHQERLNMGLARIARKSKMNSMKRL